MHRQCQRPDCAELASVSYSFDADRQLVILDHLDHEIAATVGVLCFRHAGTMVLPRGWWLDDRRQKIPTLFAGLKRDLEARRPPVRKARGEARRPRSSLPSLLVSEPGGEPAAASIAAATQIVTSEVQEPIETPAVIDHLWSPDFDVEDDLGGLLKADGPLLSRAFGSKAQRRQKKA